MYDKQLGRGFDDTTYIQLKFGSQSIQTCGHTFPEKVMELQFGETKDRMEIISSKIAQEERSASGRMCAVLAKFTL